MTPEIKPAPAVLSEDPRAKKKAHAAPRRGPVAPKKAKSAKKATSSKKTPIGGQKAPHAKDGSKAAMILALIKRPDGATANELVKATGWQPHSIRGFLSGTIRKKMGLAVTSTNGETGERTYSAKP